MICSKRNIITAVVQLLLPVLFTIGALAIARNSSKATDLPLRPLTLAAYSLDNNIMVTSRDLGAGRKRHPALSMMLTHIDVPRLDGRRGLVVVQLGQQ